MDDLNLTELLQALTQGVLIGSTYGLLALGMGLVYSVSGIVNFSHGDFVSLGMFMCLTLYGALALDPYPHAPGAAIESQSGAEKAPPERVNPFSVLGKLQKTKR